MHPMVPPQAESGVTIMKIAEHSLVRDVSPQAESDEQTV